jgi:pimeloyl-ACP methyl ester carboxylesterase
MGNPGEQEERMRFESRRLASALAAAAAGLTFFLMASPATAVEFERLDGFNEPGTPDNLDRVGILKVGPERARNVLVLNPGTSASAAYFRPMAEWVTEQAKGWQVWAVERRENLLEDHSLFDRQKAGTATPQETFEYYLGWLADPSITDHIQLIPDADVAFARNWGMRTEINDLHRVVEKAKRLGGKVVLGGHSLGGSITTAYATWDFNGTPGFKGLSGLVYIDGGSNPVPLTPAEATQALQSLQASSPWLVFGGIPSPFTGLFNTGGSLAALIDPSGPSIGQAFPLLPANLKPPCPATNLSQYGYALDQDTSPPGLFAAQAHLGRLAPTGANGLCGWDQAGEITPIGRYAEMFSGWGLPGLDGTAWYHPQRLTIDSQAVAAGNANPAQQILDVRAIHGDELPKKLRIYAFGASGGQRILDSARALADQSDIPRSHLTLIDRQATYSHNDPNSAFPDNDFVEALVPFLRQVPHG